MTNEREDEHDLESGLEKMEFPIMMKKYFRP